MAIKQINHHTRPREARVVKLIPVSEGNELNSLLKFNFPPRKMFTPLIICARSSPRQANADFPIIHEPAPASFTLKISKLKLKILVSRKVFKLLFIFRTRELNFRFFIALPPHFLSLRLYIVQRLCHV